MVGHVGQHVAGRNSAHCFGLQSLFWPSSWKISYSDCPTWLDDWNCAAKGPWYRRGAIKEKFITQCTVSLADSRALLKVKTDESFRDWWCKRDFSGNRLKDGRVALEGNVPLFSYSSSSTVYPCRLEKEWIVFNKTSSRLALLKNI